VQLFAGADDGNNNGEVNGDDLRPHGGGPRRAAAYRDNGRRDDGVEARGVHAYLPPAALGKAYLNWLGWIVLFLLAVWCGVCVWQAFAHGSILRAIHGADSFGNTCGRDNRGAYVPHSLHCLPFWRIA
jgi:hypothetical protein